MHYAIKQIDIYKNQILQISIKSSRNSFVPSMESENKEYLIDEFEYKLTMCNQIASDINFVETDNVPIKLYENSRYWFEFYQVYSFENLDLINAFLYNAQINEEEKSILGFYDSNNFVGILNLESLNINENHIEVESKKINYKDDFSRLVEELSENIIDLISMDSSFHQNMISKSSKVNDRKENLYSSFSYIKSFLSFDKMPMYLSHLMKKPFTKTITTIEEKFIWENDEIDSDNLIAAYQDASNLFKLDTRNFAFPVFTIPLVTDSTSYSETIDTFENQFVKHILELLYDYLYNIDKNGLGKKFKWEILQCKIIVGQYLDSSFFSQISKLKYLSLNSKVLHRKYPYNKFLKFYFSWDMSSSVFLDMYDEMFCMGQKDVPTMYEYFCFITFVKEFDKRYERENLINNNLLKYKNNTFNFTLKSGIESKVVYSLKNSYQLKLYYNKEYNSDKYIVNGRSYANPLKPDISLELFYQEKLIGLLHFDAKYKIDHNETFNSDDINKMHTYKDAIMGTIASYILYPGSKEKIFRQEERGLESDDIFPSVGACPLSINTSRSEVSYIFYLIEKFIILKNNRSGKYSLPAITYDGIKKIIGKEEKSI